MGALLVIVLILAAILILAAVIKKEYHVERSIVIDRSVADVYDHVRFLKNQEHFSVWVMKDPTMNKEFKGNDGTVGCVYSWDGNDKVGEGEQEIVGLEPNKKVNIEIRFVRPFKNVAMTPFTMQPAGNNQTKLTWSMDGSNKFPMTLMNLFIGSLLGKDMEQSLQLVKHTLETNK